MKQPSELTHERLADLVGRICDILWRDPVTGELDPDRSWDVETLEDVSGVVEDAVLKPDPVRPASRTAEGAATPRLPCPRGNDIEEPPVVAMRAALEAFVRTIEATGGCIRPARADGGPPGEDAIDFDDARPVPVGDDGWPDLADAYVLACGALGRRPMVRNSDTDRSPQDTDRIPC